MKRLVVSLLFVTVVIGLAACGARPTPESAAAPTAAAVPTVAAPAANPAAQETPVVPIATPIVPINDPSLQKTASGLQYADIVVGTGATPLTTDWVTVQYTVTLPDGSLIAASSHSGGPAKIPLEDLAKQIPGWAEGMSTMKVGSIRELVVPPNLAFGEKGNGSVPPNATLVFVIEMLDTKPAPQVKIEDKVVGTGTEAASGMNLKVSYTGTLTNGTVFDSSAGKAPFEFVLGAKQVIPGWDQGLLGMKVGGKRTLTIPSELAYGPQGSGPIPPDATIIFDIELLDAQLPQPVKAGEGLKIEDTLVGTGAEAVAGKTVGVYYTGKLQDGTVFDSNVGKTPLSFVVGAGQMIPGFDQGVQGMKVGGKRTITIPPALGYGAQGQGAIPPNATLTFEVELADVK